MFPLVRTGVISKMLYWSFLLEYFPLLAEIGRSGRLPEIQKRDSRTICSTRVVSFVMSENSDF